MRSDHRWWPPLLMLAVVVLTPWLGSEIVSPSALADSTELSIFLNFRVPRLLLGLLAGSALSIAGCLFQAVLRNPLADPYTLGVSSGAALGAVIVIFLDIAWIWTGSTLGALAALGLIASMFIRQRRISATGLVLAGVSVNSVCAAFIILLQSVSGFAKSFSVTTWLVGSVDALSFSSLAYYAAVVVPLMLWIVWKSPDWDLLSMGDAWAAGRGVPVRTLLVQACLAGSILTAATVSLTGPIGFVGLIVPHLVRHRTGASHRMLLPAVLFCGAAFLATCDAIARTVLRPAEIPVGVITALIGGPGLIWILRSERSQL